MALESSPASALERVAGTSEKAAAPTARSQAWFTLAAVATGAVVLFVRLFRLDQLQNELYGDITIIYEYVANIRQWKWPTYFDVSAGPLYHYLITPLIVLAGPSYFSFKLASVLVSLGVLAVTYALSRRLIDDWFALLAVAVAGVSSWLLIFSRLGNSQILVPLLATGALWLVVRFAQEGRQADLIAAAIVSALGLYVYPQSFILPGVTFLALLSLRLTRPSAPERGRGGPQRIRWIDLATFAGVSLVCALPFAVIFERNFQGFMTGYIGGKLQSVHPLAQFGNNFVRAMLAFHGQGDISSRSNIRGVAELDWVSGVLLLVGIVFWLLPARWRWSPVLLLPLVLLQVPSMLVLTSTQEVPSASRTLGAAPLIYILVASGLWWLIQIARRSTLREAVVVACLGLGIIIVTNAYRYFDVYLPGLPAQNTPVGQKIADYADSLPPGTKVYLVGCCWQDSMPEPKSVRYSVARPDDLNLVSDPSVLTCDQLQFLTTPVVFIWSDQQDLPAPQLAACRAWLPAQVFTNRDGLPIFRAAPVLTGRALPPAEAAAGTVAEAAAQPGAQPGDQDLVYSTTRYRGQTIGVRHSPLDIGQVSDLFDGNPDTLLRGQSANPLVLELRFDQPITATELSLTLGTMAHFRAKVGLTYADGSHEEVVQTFADLPADPTISMALPEGNRTIKIARVEIEDLTPPAGNGYHTHVRDLALR